MIKVDVTIRDGDYNWSRTLMITNQDAPSADLRNPDHIGHYQVELYAGPDPSRTPRRVERFEHRYGDDSLTLVSKAIDALGGQDEPVHQSSGTQQR